MSHFSQISVKIKDRECAIKALETLGCKGQIEVHETPQQIFDYCGKKTQYAYGDTKDPRFKNGDCAHLIVRRKFMGKAQNDFGIYIDGDESRVFLCDFARGCDLSCIGNAEAQKLGSYNKWLDRFKQEYSYELAKKTYAKKNLKVNRVQDGNKIKLFVTAK